MIRSCFLCVKRGMECERGAHLALGALMCLGCLGKIRAVAARTRQGAEPPAPRMCVFYIRMSCSKVSVVGLSRASG